MSYHKLWRKAQDNPTEFSVWVGLLDLVEKQQNIDYARQSFEAFFQRFPYCYGYWKKYAEMERHKGNKEKCLQVYERGVQAIPLSIDLWTAYLDAAMENFHGRENYRVKMRSLYEEALSVAGLEFRSDALWEHYISWETGHNRLADALNIYTRLLATPTQLYYQNWDSFNKLVEENRPEDILSRTEFAQFHAQVSLASIKSGSSEQKKESSEEMEPPILCTTKSGSEITDATRAAIRQLIIESREPIYRNTYMQIMKRWYFEEKIRRPYFHVKPLEEMQLNNWGEYLSFEEMEAAGTVTAIKEELKSRGDLSEEQIDGAVASRPEVQLAKRRVCVLYERCLVACSLYEHFWIRYAKYLEYTEGNIPAAREVWRRACNIHLPYKPTIHWHWACFEDRYPADLDSTPCEILTGLDIMTSLEKRLTDSALVCLRRADAMRRAGKPLFDIIACLRNGINRLRYLVSEQNKVAKCVSGATASRTVAQAIATASQARAGCGVLVGRLARLLHRDQALYSEGIPVWMLLLNSHYVEEEEDPIPIDFAKPEEISKLVEKIESTDEGVTESKDKIEETVESQSKADTEMEDMDAEENHDSEMDGVSDSNEDEASSKDEESDGDADNVEESISDDDQSNEVSMDVSHSPQTERQSRKRKMGNDKKTKRKVNSKKKKEEGEKSGDESQAAKEADLAAEEEERIRVLLNKRHKLVEICAPDPSELTDEDKVVISGEEAAIRVLKEAIEYDPRNERLYAQLLDIVYQRRPVDIDGFIEMCNFASIDSVLPAHVKLAFCQRKLQFLEEFDTDLCRLNATYEEYMSLCNAINTGVMTSAAARGTSRFLPGYPLPDLLNIPTTSLRVTSVIGANACELVASATPVARQPCLNTDQSALEAAASVGTPAPEPSTAAGYYTAGAYEPLAAALGNTSGLPPPVPTGLPVITPSMALVPGLTEAAASNATLTTDSYAAYYYSAASANPGVLATNIDYALAGTVVPTAAATNATVSVSAAH